MRYALLVGACALGLIACRDATAPEEMVTLRSGTPFGTAESTLPSPPPFAPAPHAVGVYNGPEGLYDFCIWLHGARVPTRYVLYGDGRFEMQFSSYNYGVFSYTGRYSQNGTVLTFEWDGWSVAGPWGASGTLDGDTLHVRYNDVMMWTDFIDGPYVLAR